MLIKLKGKELHHLDIKPCNILLNYICNIDDYKSEFYKYKGDIDKIFKDKKEWLI